MEQGTALKKPANTAPERPAPADAVQGYKKRIADLEREVRQLRSYKQMAVIDHLTQIFNRRYFDTRLEEEVARMSRQGFPFCVALLDLDHFKHINDTHGHCIGDVVLREFARFLRQNLRRVDVVCRIGGEEFAIIMPDTDITAGLVIMQRILQKLVGHPFTIHGHPPIQISFSCGIVSNALSFKDHHAIVDEADQALYEAKRNGRSQIMARNC